MRYSILLFSILAACGGGGSDIKPLHATDTPPPTPDQTNTKVVPNALQANQENRQVPSPPPTTAQAPIAHRQAGDIPTVENSGTPTLPNIAPTNQAQGQAATVASPQAQVAQGNATGCQSNTWVAINHNTDGYPTDHNGVMASKLMCEKTPTNDPASLTQDCQCAT